MSEQYFRANIRRMAGYVPGEQPSDGEQLIKLNTNENPYPPSPAVLEAIRRETTDAVRRYPEPMADTFRKAAADVLGVGPEMILAGNGSDDLLTIVTRAFVGEGKLIVTPTPSYVLYETLAEIQGARLKRVPFEADWQLPDAFADGEASVTFLPNPNSPSGTLVEAERILELSERMAGPLVVDEAYVDFADGDCLDLVRRSDKIIVLRTFSKGYSLAGIRFGYAVAPERVIAGLTKVKDSYNCDRLSIAAAAAAIADQDYHRQCMGRIKATRARLQEAARGWGFEGPESQANFVWAVGGGHDARRIYEELKSRGILVRYMQYEGAGDGLRITVGTDEEIDALVAAMEQVV